MKTPEVALTEWTSGEIKFDFGRGPRTFSRENFTAICDVVKSGVINDRTIKITDANGSQWDVLVRSFSDEQSMHDAARAVERYYKKDQFCAQVAVQFHTLDEVISWTRGEIEGKNGVPVQKVPPVDPWMRPVHR